MITIKNVTLRRSAKVLLEGANVTLRFRANALLRISSKGNRFRNAAGQQYGQETRTEPSTMA